MKARYAIIASAILSALLVSGCVRLSAPTVTFDQLFSDPSRYNGKTITMEGFYFSGFEIIVLAEKLESSGYAEGHLIPEGKMLWVESGIPKEIYDQLYQQQMMGPTERYGKIRVTGEFQYGGKYGHLGAYESQITPSKVELLDWSPGL